MKISILTVEDSSHFSEQLGKFIKANPQISHSICEVEIDNNLLSSIIPLDPRQNTDLTSIN